MSKWNEGKIIFTGKSWPKIRDAIDKLFDEGTFRVYIEESDEREPEMWCDDVSVQALRTDLIGIGMHGEEVHSNHIEVTYKMGVGTG